MSKIGKRSWSQMNVKTFNLAISGDNHKFLKAVAKSKGTSMSKEIDDWLDKRRTKYTERLSAQIEDSSL